MESVRSGRRLLMALDHDDLNSSHEPWNLSTWSVISLTVASFTLLTVLLIACVCRKKEKTKETDPEEPEESSQRTGSRSMGPNHPQLRHEANSVSNPQMENGALSPNRNSAPVPGHSRQASASSVHNMRPTSLRELPEPPVSSHHCRNTSLSGVVDISTNPGSVGNIGANNTSVLGSAGGISDFHLYHQPTHPRTATGTVSPTVFNNDVLSSGSDGYDHLGPAPRMKPIDYDCLVKPETADADTPVSETGPGLDGHYSQLRERTYAVVKDVKGKEPYNKKLAVKDKQTESQRGSPSHYSQLKDEDPYNHIGDSDGAISAGVISRIRQFNGMDDPYSTVQDGSGGDLRTILESQGVSANSLQHTISSTVEAPSLGHFGDGSDEYAVVRKSATTSSGYQEVTDGQNNESSGISPYNVGPPEPPRMYTAFDEDSDVFGDTAQTRPVKEHKYSKVTARESLASMTARNALNPYETVPDLPENMYATVEGGSGDGVVGEVMMRSRTNNGVTESRLSQNSDTYAEIAISGGGLNTSVISNSSSAGGNSIGNNNHSSSSSIMSPNVSGGGGGGAPVPPSLDSLHLMTKSQTSSEGDRLSDRLSDRHLASPEDSALGIPIWGEDECGVSGGSTEDGYSTLKRAEAGSPLEQIPVRHFAIPPSSPAAEPDSGGVTLVKNYQSVKDCISDNETADDLENDPNYESVDEARAKVASLNGTTSGEIRTTFFSSIRSSSSHVTVLQVFPRENPNHATRNPGNSPRKRRPDHDYEEVDISPPLTPSQSATPLASPHFSPQPSSVLGHNQPPDANSSQISQANERPLQNHMYEELAEVRSRSQKVMLMNRSGAENKKKSGSNELKKNSSEAKGKSGHGSKKKSGSVFSNGTRL